MAQLMVGVVSAALCVTSIISIYAQGKTASKVDLVLILALDVSGSVDEDEFELQRRGLETAFRHPQVIAAIRRGMTGRIAVTAVQWAGYRNQHIAVPWSIIESSPSAARFADRLARMPRHFPDGPTHLSGVIRFATRLAGTAPFQAARRVIDVSGDGKNNIGEPPPQARDDAVSSGMTINGLSVLNASEALEMYYRSQVIGGPGAFVISAADYEDYPRAILRKLLREIELQLT
ncbi:MAG: DUF1194 domain-containing protein [Hyphomicrobiaceae bacterium]